MALISRAFDTFHILELLKAATEDLDSGKRHSTHKRLQQLIALRILGGEALQDADLPAEPAIKALFQWDGLIRRFMADGLKKNDMAT